MQTRYEREIKNFRSSKKLLVHDRVTLLLLWIEECACVCVLLKYIFWCDNLLVCCKIFMSQTRIKLKKTDFDLYVSIAVTFSIHLLFNRIDIFP